jgi:hypothetical protein
LKNFWMIWAGTALLLFTLLTGLAGPGNQAQAQAVPPAKDYTRATEDGKYLLVMLAPANLGQPDPALRRKYSQPGLYPNDGSTTPIWTTDWASWYQDQPDSQLYTTPDGKYLARVDANPHLALAFYVIGVEVKRYSLYELAPGLAVQPALSSGPTAWVKKANLDTAQNRFVVDTINDERLEFSMTSGQRLPGIGKPDSLALVAALVFIGLFTLIIAIVAFTGIKRQSKSRRKAPG